MTTIGLNGSACAMSSLAMATTTCTRSHRMLKLWMKAIIYLGIFFCKTGNCPPSVEKFLVICVTKALECFIRLMVTSDIDSLIYMYMTFVIMDLPYIYYVHVIYKCTFMKLVVVSLCSFAPCSLMEFFLPY